MWFVLTIAFIVCAVLAVALRQFWMRRNPPDDNDRSRQHDVTDPSDVPPHREPW